MITSATFVVEDIDLPELDKIIDEMFKAYSGPVGSEYREANPGVVTSRYLHISSVAVSDDGLSKI